MDTGNMSPNFWDLWDGPPHKIDKSFVYEKTESLFRQRTAHTHPFLFFFLTNGQLLSSPVRVGTYRQLMYNNNALITCTV